MCVCAHMSACVCACVESTREPWIPQYWSCSCLWNALGLQLFVGYLACYTRAGIQTPVLMIEPRVLLTISPAQTACSGHQIHPL